jgi:carbamoyltransferase
MQTLGISVAHDSAVCVVRDGEIVAYYKEERLVGQKHAKMPLTALQRVVEEFDHFDAIAYCPVEEEAEFKSFILDYLSKTYDMAKIFIFDLSREHHLQHASMAFYNSGFKSAAVVVVDRMGSGFGVAKDRKNKPVGNASRECESIFSAKYPASIDTVYKNHWIIDMGAHQAAMTLMEQVPHLEIEAGSLFGIVTVYEAATTAIGQNALENGKAMGLAAYGDKRVKYPKFFVEGTHIPIDYYFKNKNVGDNFFQTIYKDFSQQPEDFSETNYQEYANLAYQVQKQTQEAVGNLVEKAVRDTGETNIVLVGGYAMNVVANAYLLRRFPNLKFYFEPVADDSGTAIGGAMFAYRIQSQDMTIRPQQHTFYHGGQHDLSGVDGEIVTVSDIAKLLSEDKAIAIYEGLAEAGQRALGHRSILFNPLNKEAKALVNRIKNREWYRPFGAMVLEEDAKQYFDMSIQEKNPFMTVAFDAKKTTADLMPGIVHADGTCRIQTVGKDNSTMYDLLCEVKRLTGHGVLLNTSFNLAGKPLVETPDDALSVLQDSPLDGVWFPEVGLLVNR